MTIGIVEDRPAVRAAFARSLRRTFPDAQVLPWASAEECLKDPRSQELDIALLDIGLEGLSGIELCALLSDRSPGLPILMLTTYADPETIFAAIRAGALGYLLKTETGALPEAVRDALAGGSPMTPTIARRVIEEFRNRPGGAPGGAAAVSDRTATDAVDVDSDLTLTLRERDVLTRLAAGAPNAAIAGEMQISVNTVKFHIKNIYRKLHVKNRGGMVDAALRRGLI